MLYMHLFSPCNYISFVCARYLPLPFLSRFDNANTYTDIINWNSSGFYDYTPMNLNTDNYLVGWSSEKIAITTGNFHMEI